MSLKLKKIDCPKPFLIHSIWQDGFEATIRIDEFRNSCPCADCTEKKDENKGGFISLDTLKPGKYSLRSISQVGNYALNPIWQDGHDTCIYPFEFLRNIFEKYKLDEDKIQEIIKSKQKLMNN